MHSSRAVPNVACVAKETVATVEFIYSYRTVTTVQRVLTEPGLL